MKKIISALIALTLLFSFSFSAFAEPAPAVSGLRKLINAYLPGLTETDKDKVENLSKDYMANGGTIAGSGAYMRCIREVGELMGMVVERNVDMEAGTMDYTVKEVGELYFKNLDEETQTKVIAKVTEGFEAIGLEVSYTNFALKVTKPSADPDAEDEVVFSKTLISLLRRLFNAHLPGLTNEDKTTLESFSYEFSAEGGGMAGSGAYMRCIREIGALMGMEVEQVTDMAAGVVNITVKKVGETKFKNLDKATQDAVIAKAKEGLTAIGFEANFEDGVLTVTKENEERFVKTLIETEPTKDDETTAATTTASTAAKTTATAPKDLADTGEENNSAALAIAVVAVTCLAVVLVKKRKIDQ